MRSTPSSTSSRFQPTRPLRGATTTAGRMPTRSHYFNPRAPCGARPGTTTMLRTPTHFNPRAPCGARRLFQCGLASGVLISTHAPLAGRDQRGGLRAGGGCISTHAPLAGRDDRPAQRDRHTYISTHAPLAGRDVDRAVVLRALAEFQPTRPLRGATISSPSSGSGMEFQPTRPLRGATVPSSIASRFAWKFQPTRPLRGATEALDAVELLFDISTHAPLAGRDGLQCGPLQADDHFNPRAPCGARRAVIRK